MSRTSVAAPHTYVSRIPFVPGDVERLIYGIYSYAKYNVTILKRAEVTRVAFFPKP